MGLYVFMLSSGWIATPRISTAMVRRRFEPTQKGNRHKLPIKQHVWPVASIHRFTNARAQVQLYDKIRNKRRTAKPSDQVFYADRVWDNRAEAGYMKKIEDKFQDLAMRVIEESTTTIDARDKVVVDYFFALWQVRAAFRNAPDGEVQLNAVTGHPYTKEEEERFEKAGVAFIRAGGRVPARNMYGIRMQRDVDWLASGLANVQWGIVYAGEGEFVVPDRPAHEITQIIPLEPDLCLCAGGKSGVITRENLKQINDALRERSVEYYFAQDLASCP